MAMNFDNKTITDDNELSKIFSKCYINIVQNTTGTTLVKISLNNELNNDKLAAEEIIKTYENQYHWFINIIDLNLANIINNNLSRNFFSHSNNVASVRPIFKRDGRTNMKKL